jgi:chitodextrinase
VVVTTGALSGCALPPAVVASTVTGSSVTITWASVPSAGWYDFRYRIVGAPTWTYGGSAGAAATSKIYTGLLPGTPYEFEGRTFCVNGLASGYSSVMFTTTALAGCELPPVLNPTPMSVTGTTIQVSWPAVTGAAWYSFQYKMSSSSTWISGGTSGASATNKTFVGLLPNTSYDFQARTHCATGIASAWSATVTASTNGTPAMQIAGNDKLITTVDKAINNQGHETVVYPNPAADQVNIDIFISEENTPSSIQVLDMSGRVVRQMNVQTATGVNTISVDIRDLSNGMYTLLMYQNANLLFTSKVKKN